jgi:dienelactone hydrolase
MRLPNMRMPAAIIFGLSLVLAPGHGAAGQATDNPGFKAPPRTVMQYLGDRALRMAAALPPLPDTLAAWEKRRATVRHDLTRLLGLPAREPMRAKVLATREDGDLVVEDVAYLWGERAYVSANVVRPKKSTGALPALVVPPGFLGELKAEIYKTFVYHIARRGYLLLFIDDPHVGRRAAPRAGLYATASAAGTQVMGIQVFDTLRGLDYLLTRVDVDPGRIGVAGLCQGSEQTWLAAALEDRFRIAVPVCGTTTYAHWAHMPAATGVDLSDPSPYVAGVLRHTDWHEINACIAPRSVYIASNSGDNWWPAAGYDQVVSTLDAAFRLYGKPQNFQHLRVLRSHSMTPFIPELSPWIDKHLSGLAASPAASPLPSIAPDEADFSMLHHAQRRIVKQASALPTDFTDCQAWADYRKSTIEWLGKVCDLHGLRLREPKTLSRETAEGLLTELVAVPQDEALELPVMLLWRESETPSKRSAVVLSHDSTQCASERSVKDFARALAEDGYLVAIPEHAAANRASRRAIKNISSLYGASDTVDLPPMAMRVWDDLATIACLSSRKDVGRIALVGLGVGGVDAAITAAVDDHIAAVGVVGAVTVRDWAEQVAPKLNDFDRILPYLPHIMARTDLQYLYSAAAPRPLLLVDAADRSSWPAAAYARVRKTAQRIYGLHGAASALTVKGIQSPWGIEEVRQWLRAAGRSASVRYRPHPPGS